MGKSFSEGCPPAHVPFFLWTYNPKLSILPVRLYIKVTRHPACATKQQLPVYPTCTSACVPGWWSKYATVRPSVCPFVFKERLSLAPMRGQPFRITKLSFSTFALSLSFPPCFSFYLALCTSHVPRCTPRLVSKRHRHHRSFHIAWMSAVSPVSLFTFSLSHEPPMVVLTYTRGKLNISWSMNATHMRFHPTKALFSYANPQGRFVPKFQIQSVTKIDSNNFNIHRENLFLITTKKLKLEFIEIKNWLLEQMTDT